MTIATQPPGHVALAIKLLWAGIGIEIVKQALFFDYSNSKALGMAFAVGITIGLVCAVMAFFISKMAQGKNWARLTMTILFVASLLPTAIIIKQELALHPIMGLLSSLETLLTAIGYGYLFTPTGREWFRNA